MSAALLLPADFCSGVPVAALEADGGVGGFHPGAADRMRVDTVPPKKEGRLWQHMQWVRETGPAL